MLFFLFHFLFHSLSHFSLFSPSPLSFSSFLLCLFLIEFVFNRYTKSSCFTPPTNSFLLFPFSFSASFLFDLLPLCKLSSVLLLVMLLLGKPVCWSHTPEIISLVRVPPLCLVTTVTLSLLMESQSIFNHGILQLNRTMIAFALCHTVRQMYFFSASLSPHQHRMKMSAPSGTLKFNTTAQTLMFSLLEQKSICAKTLTPFRAWRRRTWSRSPNRWALSWPKTSMPCGTWSAAPSHRKASLTYSTKLSVQRSPLNPRKPPASVDPASRCEREGEIESEVLSSWSPPFQFYADTRKVWFLFPLSTLSRRATSLSNWCRSSMIRPLWCENNDIFGRLAPIWVLLEMKTFFNLMLFCVWFLSFMKATPLSLRYFRFIMWSI